MFYHKNIISCCLLGSLCSLNLWGNEINSNHQTINQNREALVIYSRQGETQHREAIVQLEQLYKQSNDLLVRDDLIALLLQEDRWQEAVDVCHHCSMQDYSQNELENLARAWRNLKQYNKALNYYNLLYQKYPQNKNGLLGKILVTIDLQQFATAKKLLLNYNNKFGKDSNYQSAYHYWLDSAEGDIAKLARWQRELERNPQNTEHIKQLYLLAAKYKLYPLQQKLLSNYPQFFTEKDKLWQMEESAVVISKLANDKQQNLAKAYKQLTEVIEKTEQDSPLQIKALQDRIVIAQKLNNDQFIKQDYHQLQATDQLPDYVKQAYADYQLSQGSPFYALELYQTIAAKYTQLNQPIPNSLLFKLFSAASDAGYFYQANDYLKQIQTTPYLQDFTRTRKIKNPDFDRLFFAQVYLQAWRGNTEQALALLDERLDIAPADIWAMFAKSEIKQWQGYDDEAEYWINKTQAFLPPPTTIRIMLIMSAKNS